QSRWAAGQTGHARASEGRAPGNSNRTRFLICSPCPSWDARPKDGPMIAGYLELPKSPGGRWRLGTSTAPRQRCPALLISERRLSVRVQPNPSDQDTKRGCLDHSCIGRWFFGATTSDGLLPAPGGPAPEPTTLPHSKERSERSIAD